MKNKKKEKLSIPRWQQECLNGADGPFEFAKGPITIYSRNLLYLIINKTDSYNTIMHKRNQNPIFDYDGKHKSASFWKNRILYDDVYFGYLLYKYINISYKRYYADFCESRCKRKHHILHNCKKNSTFFEYIKLLL